MANSKAKSSAQKTNTPQKPLHHISAGDVILSIFPDERIAFERRYVRPTGEHGYAKSLRKRDISDLAQALHEVELWFKDNESN